MAASKNVKLYIHSMIWNLNESGEREGSAEISDEEYGASLISDGVRAAVSYSRDTEGGRIASEIVFEKDSVTVKNKGAVLSVMVFSPNGTYEGVYSIPPYSFDMRIAVKAMRSSVTPSGCDANILYTMAIGGAEKSCSMKISVCEDNI